MKKTNDKEQANVGIVIPCHNLGQYIQEALDSLDQQTYQNFELVIVDDASTDVKTINTLKKLKLRKGQVIFEKRNLGLSSVRNKYMRKFNTKYVMSFDPDDILEPEFLEKSVRYLENNPKKAAVAVWLKLFGTVTGLTKFSEHKAKLPEMLISNHYLGSCLLRKAAFEDVGGYDASKKVDGAEDYDFWLMVLEKGWELGVIAEPLFNYRRSTTSASYISALPEHTAIWRKKIIAKHYDTYSQYLPYVVLEFEKKASEAHAGYVETARRYEALEAEYKEMRSYLEDQLLPSLESKDALIKKLHARSLVYQSGRAARKIRRTLKP